MTKPLIAAAEKEATTIIRDNFVAPTVGALNYSVSAFSIRWVPPAGSTELPSAAQKSSSRRAIS